MTEHTRVDARTMTVKVYREEQFLGEFRFVRAKQAKTDKKK